jgi:hypothetical protein
MARSPRGIIGVITRLIARSDAWRRRSAPLVRADHGEYDVAGALRRRDPLDALAPSHQYL